MIELLVVVSIILILMGLIMAAVGAIRQRANESATRLLIGGLSTALEQYFNDWDEYPPTCGVTGSGAGEYPPDDSSIANDGSLFLALNGPDARGTEKLGSDKKVLKRFPPFLPAMPEHLRKLDDKVLIVDAFRQPLRYFNCEAYIRSKLADIANQAERTKKRAELEKSMHSSRFEIYSLGVNGRFDEKRHDMKDDNEDKMLDDVGEPGDDITNWDAGVVGE